MSSFRRHDVPTGLMTFCAVCCQASALPPGFYPLGELAGGEIHSHGYALSADGSVAVGISVSSAGPEAFRWTVDGGMVGLGDLPGGGVNSAALGVSAQGDVIVGLGSTPGEHSFRWTADGGMVDIAPSGAAWGLSDDGSVVVGISGSQAYRWTESTGPIGLGDLPGGTFFSLAFDVSNDGDTVVGRSTSASGVEAFRWTAETGMMAGLGDLPGGGFSSQARGVSADGSVIVGYGESASGQEAFRWTAEDGMVSLTPGTFGVAIDVSADGSVIVGGGGNQAGGVFVWDEVHGLRSMRDMLGLNLSDWDWIEPEGISDDGSTIIGWGYHADTATNEAWIAVLPEPSTLALVAFGGLILTRRHPREP